MIWYNCTESDFCDYTLSLICTLQSGATLSTDRVQSDQDDRTSMVRRASSLAIWTVSRSSHSLYHMTDDHMTSLDLCQRLLTESASSATKGGWCLPWSERRTRVGTRVSIIGSAVPCPAFTRYDHSRRNLAHRPGIDTSRGFMQHFASGRLRTPSLTFSPPIGFPPSLPRSFFLSHLSFLHFVA